MEWHVDDILYQPEQVEVVLTLENTSDCNTMWKPHDQPITPPLDPSHCPPMNVLQEKIHIEQHKQKYNIESVQTTPNSALLLKAGGVEHKVSPLKVGKRIILKMAFVKEEAVINVGMEEHVTHYHAKNHYSTSDRNASKHIRQGKKVIKKKKISRQKR